MEVGKNGEPTVAKRNKALIRHDKCLLSKEIRRLFVTCLEIGGRQHEVKEVVYFPEEITRQEIFDQPIFFVPVIPLGEENLIHPKKSVMPIFMLDLNQEQKKELSLCARHHKWYLCNCHFNKPRITLSYEQKEEFFEDGGFDDED